MVGPPGRPHASPLSQVHDRYAQIKKFNPLFDPENPGVFLCMHIRKWRKLPLSPSAFIPKYQDILNQLLPETTQSCISYSADDNTFHTVFFNALTEPFINALREMHQRLTGSLGCELRVFFCASRFHHVREALGQPQPGGPGIRTGTSQSLLVLSAGLRPRMSNHRPDTISTKNIWIPSKNTFWPTCPNPSPVPRLLMRCIFRPVMSATSSRRWKGFRARSWSQRSRWIMPGTCSATRNSPSGISRCCAGMTASPTSARSTGRPFALTPSGERGHAES